MTFARIYTQPYQQTFKRHALKVIFGNKSNDKEKVGIRGETNNKINCLTTRGEEHRQRKVYYENMPEIFCWLICR